MAGLGGIQIGGGLRAGTALTSPTPPTQVAPSAAAFGPGGTLMAGQYPGTSSGGFGVAHVAVGASTLALIALVFIWWSLPK